MSTTNIKKKPPPNVDDLPIYETIDENIICEITQVQPVNIFL